MIDMSKMFVTFDLGKGLKFTVYPKVKVVRKPIELLRPLRPSMTIRQLAEAKHSRS